MPCTRCALDDPDDRIGGYRDRNHYHGAIPFGFYSQALSSRMQTSDSQYRIFAESAAGRTSAIVVPGWGANVFSFAHHIPGQSTPIPIFEAVEMSRIAQRPGSYGMPLLAPFAGRVGRNQNGMFIYAGVQYRANPARHGFLRDSRWNVINAANDSISCSLEVRPGSPAGESVFPFEFDANYSVSLSIQELKCVLTITSRAAYKQPLSVGWHPYLARNGRCEIHIPAGARWQLDREAEPTPTGELLRVSGRDDFRRGRALSEQEHWDDIFSDLTASGQETHAWSDEYCANETHVTGRSRTRIRRRVSVPAVGNSRRGVISMPEMQLYTPIGRAAICLEPLSAPPNNVNLGTVLSHRADSIDLLPGETRQFEIRVTLELQEI